jgi:hypothetical protein
MSNLLVLSLHVVGTSDLRPRSYNVKGKRLAGPPARPGNDIEVFISQFSYYDDVSAQSSSARKEMAGIRRSSRASRCWRESCKKAGVS